jgi:hypothetical protein
MFWGTAGAVKNTDADVIRSFALVNKKLMRGSSAGSRHEGIGGPLVDSLVPLCCWVTGEH